MILHDIQVSVGGHHVPVAPEVQVKQPHLAIEMLVR